MSNLCLEPRLFYGIAAATQCSSCPVRPVSFCNAMSEPDLTQLAAIITRHRAEPLTTFVHEGALAEDAFNITGGIVRVSKLLPDGRQQITAFLAAGDFLGLTPGPNYRYSATALTAVTYCRFPRRKLDQLLLQYPELDHRLLGIAATELAAAEDQMLLLGRKSAVERLASFVLMLLRKGWSTGRSPSELWLPMTRYDIADYLGLTVFTVAAPSPSCGAPASSRRRRPTDPGEGPRRAGVDRGGSRRDGVSRLVRGLGELLQDRRVRQKPSAAPAPAARKSRQRTFDWHDEQRASTTRSIAGAAVIAARSTAIRSTIRASSSRSPGPAVARRRARSGERRRDEAGDRGAAVGLGRERVDLVPVGRRRRGWRRAGRGGAAARRPAGRTRLSQTPANGTPAAVAAVSIAVRSLMRAKGAWQTTLIPAASAAFASATIISNGLLAQPAAEVGKPPRAEPGGRRAAPRQAEEAGAEEEPGADRDAARQRHLADRRRAADRQHRRAGRHQRALGERDAVVERPAGAAGRAELAGLDRLARPRHGACRDEEEEERAVADLADAVEVAVEQRVGDRALAGELEIDQHAGDVVEHVGEGEPVVRRRAVEQHRPFVDDEDVAQPEVAVAEADAAGEPPLLEPAELAQRRLEHGVAQRAHPRARQLDPLRGLEHVEIGAQRGHEVARPGARVARTRR